MKISKLHYITADHSTKSHSKLCEEACLAGVDWIQLRMKNVTEDDFLNQAEKCRSITDKYGAKLIINDNLSIAIKVKADGVHLGQEDLNTQKARELVGKDFIIGGTANTMEQILEHVENGVDYVGIGPLRHTETKKNLSPIIGFKGYVIINKALRSRNINTTLIAIGGVSTSDIIKLRDIGVYGVAISSLINRSKNKKELVSEITKKLDYGVIENC